MAEEMKPEQLPTTPRRFTRRATMIGTIATVAAAGLDAVAGKWEFLEGSKLMIPEYVHAMAGVEEEVRSTAGQVIGRHFTQTGDKISQGFPVVDNGQGQFWTAFQRLGGVDKLGYPISWPLPSPDGFSLIQMFQAGVLQVNAAEAVKQGVTDGTVLFNACDKEGLNGIENSHPQFAAQLNNEGVPAHKEGSFSAEDRLTWLQPDTYLHPQDQAAAERLRKEYFNRGGPTILGYPTSMLDNRGLFTGLRLQRGILQLWNLKLPDHPELPDVGTVTSFLVGDLLKRGNWVSQDMKVSLNPGRYTTGGVNGSVNGTEIISPELPFPLEIGEFQKDGIVVHNKGTTRGLVLNNPDYFQNYLGKIAKRFFPQGVEYFISDLSITDYGKLLNAIRSNPNYEQKLLVATDWNLYNAAYKNSSMTGLINKTTGRLEIYINLPILSGKPTQENAPMPDVNIMVSYYGLELALIYSAGGPFGGPFYYDDPQIQEWRRAVTTPGPVFVLVSKG